MGRNEYKHDFVGEHPYIVWSENLDAIVEGSAEPLPDGSVTVSKLGDDVIALIDEKADSDGTYPDMTVGFADNLTGKNDAVGAEFIYRTTGGNADVADGNAIIDAIKGNTIVWNHILLSVNVNDIKTVGFNAFDATSGKAELLGGNEYQITGAYTAVSYETIDGETETLTIADDGTFTPVSNGTLTVTGAENVCIHLTWSGYRNGEFEEYWQNTLALPVMQYFPDGMRSAGSAYDELQSDKAIMRIGAVDLGTLEWTTTLTSEADVYRLASSGIVSTIKPPLGGSVKANVICAAYDTITTNDTYAKTKGIAIATNGYISVYDPNYNTSSSASAFTTAMSGVYLFYELATPVETAISPALDLSYKVSDFGTEKFIVPSGKATAPVIAEIAYNMNAVDTLRRLPVNYISHESFENFIAALATYLEATITESWDSANNEYTYVIEAAAEQQSDSAPEEAIEEEPEKVEEEPEEVEEVAEEVAEEVEE